MSNQPQNTNLRNVSCLTNALQTLWPGKLRNERGKMFCSGKFFYPLKEVPFLTYQKYKITPIFCKLTISSLFQSKAGR